MKVALRPKNGIKGLWGHKGQPSLGLGPALVLVSEVEEFDKDDISAAAGNKAWLSCSTLGQLLNYIKSS